MAEPTGHCQPVIVHTFGLDISDGASWDALFDRVSEAAHAKDEEVFCSSGFGCVNCDEPEPAPDWADIREAARNAGWTWTAQHGDFWVTQWADWRFHLPNGPGTVSMSYHTLNGWSFTLVNGPDSVSLQDPTPAKVLTAARLVGLAGAS